MSLRPFAAARALLLTAAAILASPAFATPQSVNATGLWLTPDESGWGLYLAHQGEMLFGTFFVYGPDNQPRWYSASEIRCDDRGPGAARPLACNGSLHESTGTAFHEPFSAPSVTRRQVGNVSLELASSAGTLTYTVDGVAVTKQIQPFVWRFSNVTSGFRAAIHTPATSTSAATSEYYYLSLDVDTAAATYRGSMYNDQGRSCTFSGPATAVNMGVALGGTGTCNDGRTRDVSFRLDPTPDGIVGTGPWPGSRIAGAPMTAANYVGNGWMNDLWLAPGESGWGLNLVGQGDTLFGTLFVYDATRRSKWFSASALTRTASSNPDSRGRYEGPLYESTGSWLGAASFNPNTVTRRQVGTMTIEFLGTKAANVTYTVDGTRVSTQVVPFAMRLESLTGTYVGRYIHPNGFNEDFTVTVSDNANFIMRTNSPTRTCTYPAASRGQFGHRVVIPGMYTCSDGTSGTFTIDDAEVSFEGFTGVLTLTPGNRLFGHIAAVRTGF